MKTGLAGWLCGVAAVVLLGGCGRVGERRVADVEGIDLRVRVGRFDSAFWGVDTMDVERGMAALAEGFPGVTEVYLENVVGFGGVGEERTWETYRLFRRDTAVRRLYTDCLTEYADLSREEELLTGAFRRAKYFFPQIETPRLYCHVSGFNQSIVVGEGFMSMSLDNYMGEGYGIYGLIGIYEYQRVNMVREKVVPDYVTAWLSTEFYQRAQANLLDDMIYRGKILYATAVLLPEVEDRVIMGYTKEQWEWMEMRERELWEAMQAQRALYETNALVKGQYLNDGPFTLPFTQESPSRGGAYMGWRIVDSYMARNKEVSVLQLMNQTDAQMILSRSGYRP